MQPPKKKTHRVEEGREPQYYAQVQRINEGMAPRSRFGLPAHDLLELQKEQMERDYAVDVNEMAHVKGNLAGKSMGEFMMDPSSAGKGIDRAKVQQRLLRKQDESFEKKLPPSERGERPERSERQPERSNGNGNGNSNTNSNSANSNSANSNRRGRKQSLNDARIGKHAENTNTNGGRNFGNDGGINRRNPRLRHKNSFGDHDPWQTSNQKFGEGIGYDEAGAIAAQESGSGSGGNIHSQYKETWVPTNKLYGMGIDGSSPGGRPDGPPGAAGGGGTAGPDVSERGNRGKVSSQESNGGSQEAGLGPANVRGGGGGGGGGASKLSDDNPFAGPKPQSRRRGSRGGGGGGRRGSQKTSL